MAHSLGELLAVAVVLFASTNVDDVFVLLGFFADPAYRPRQVVLGQFLGIGGLYGASVAASLVSLVIPAAYVGLLGFFPIVLGIRQLRELAGGDQAGEPTGEDGAELEANAARYGKVLAVAAVTMANGGDNISIYTPYFATRTALEIAAIGGIFAAMTLLWLAGAYWLTSHPTFGAPIRKYGRRVVPFVLIALGALILYEAGSFGLLRLE